MAMDPEIDEILHKGTVIPAHPLALTESRELDEKRQLALTKYYLASGVGGIAVGVHTTQFEIRDEGVDLFRPVLESALQAIEEFDPGRPLIKVAGAVGPTRRALSEAGLAAELGYDLVLLSMGGLESYTEEELLERTREVGEIIPVFGFYLQPAVGGRELDYEFWRRFAEIPAVKAIKVAPFDRYRTFDVVRAVCHSSRRSEIALYTGNDDNFLFDLLTTYRFKVDGEPVEKRMVGGLLGQWAFWTRGAVELLGEIKKVREKDKVPRELLAQGGDWTDVNEAVFDPSHNFEGCIPGINEMLRREGLLKGRWCLKREKELSPGQMKEIERIYATYPHLSDGEFIERHMDDWI